MQRTTITSLGEWAPLAISFWFAIPISILARAQDFWALASLPLLMWLVFFAYSWRYSAPIRLEYSIAGVIPALLRAVLAICGMGHEPRIWWIGGALAFAVFLIYSKTPAGALLLAACAAAYFA